MERVVSEPRAHPRPQPVPHSLRRTLRASGPLIPPVTPGGRDTQALGVLQPDGGEAQGTPWAEKTPGPRSVPDAQCLFAGRGQGGRRECWGAPTPPWPASQQPWSPQAQVQTWAWTASLRPDAGADAVPQRQPAATGQAPAHIPRQEVASRNVLQRVARGLQTSSWHEGGGVRAVRTLVSGEGQVLTARQRPRRAGGALRARPPPRAPVKQVLTVPSPSGLTPKAQVP